MDLSIIIVNWNSVGFLRKCLTTVYAHSAGLSFEVIVLDNASYDGCAEMVASEFGSVRFIQSELNLGFAKGNNVAAGHAVGDTLLFLNSDTEIVGEALESMLACFDSMPNVGAVGPKLLNSDGSIQDSCIQAFPSITNHFLDAAYLRSMFPRSSLWGNRVLFEDNLEPVSVEGIVGASMMIRRRVFEDIGGFDSGYFMYAEDMDLCYRLRKDGKTNYYIGTATVIHHGGQSSNQQSDKQFSAIVTRESLLSFMRIHRGPMYARLFQISTALIALFRLSLLAIAGFLPAAADRKHSMSRASAKWWRVFRWAIGAEPGVKQPA
jgi:N-acetylglucosaminyl-diphospho-decaprenol L-rhamnosyltransferase